MATTAPTSYTDIDDGAIDVDSPVTDDLMTLIRDNPIAMIKRLTGAPAWTVFNIVALSGSGNWEVPVGVSRVTVILCGGGGGGGGGGDSDPESQAGGGGGGGGSGRLVVQSITTTPLALLAYVCGAVDPAGLGGAHTVNGVAGANTTFGTFIALGGYGGTAGGSNSALVEGAGGAAGGWIGGASNAGGSGGKGKRGTLGTVSRSVWGLGTRLGLVSGTAALRDEVARIGAEGWRN